MAKYSQSGVPDNERIDNPCEYIAKLTHTHLPLSKWGFGESARFITTSPKIIYNSKWCRVKIIWNRWEMYAGNSLSILYGRLHAPDDKYRINLDGQEYHCWFGATASEVLNFLDGSSAETVVHQKGFPKIIEQFRQSSDWKKLIEARRLPEAAIRMEATIWNHYGTQLFELFDLRRPDLWEKYRQFLKEYYDIKGRSPNIKPSLDQVC